MAFLSAQYDAALGYTAQQDRLLIASMLRQGVIGPADLKVSAGSGFFSSIAGGVGVVPNTVQVNGGSYQVVNNGAVTALHTTPDATNSRLDTIYVKVFDSRDGGDSSDIVNPVVVAGTPQGGNPSSGTLLASRAGVGATPTNSLLISDVYVPNAAANAAAFTYRDRRAGARDGSAARVHYSSSTAVANTTLTVPFDIVDWDTDGCYNAISHLYTCPVGGLYLVVGCAKFTLPASGAITVQLQIGGTSATNIYVFQGTGASQIMTGTVTDVFNRNAGDTFELDFITTTGTATLNAGTYLDIARIG